MVALMNGQDRKTKEFVALLGCHSGGIHSLVRILVPNQVDAEDLFQEVCVTLWEKFASFRTGSDFRAWALQIARYKVRNFRKSRDNLPHLFDDKLIDQLACDHLSMDEHLEASVNALADCYQKLGPEDRELLDLRYLEAAPVATVAARTGRSVDFVYKALRRIYDSLYRCIDESVHGDESK
jgi:RNA polymerase sigma-70 factor (ECF subfamily)